jgi:hypothetical protein
MHKVDGDSYCRLQEASQTCNNSLGQKRRQAFIWVKRTSRHRHDVPKLQILDWEVDNGRVLLHKEIVLCEPPHVEHLHAHKACDNSLSGCPLLEQWRDSQLRSVAGQHTAG